MIRILVVDDEQPSRDRLRRLLTGFDDIQIVGEAEDGEQAIERIGQLRPDLVLLDIQMAGCSGLEVAGSLPSPRPKIIFCTAYDKYAIDAFELNAVDYLMKPVNRTRLAAAIERIRSSSVADVDKGVDKALRSPHMAPKRFLGKLGSRLHVISHKDVIYFGSEDGLTRMYTKDRNFMMELTLNDFERRLDPSIFCRISRSAIVNLDHVSEVLTLVGGHGETLLKNGVRLEVSRRKLRVLVERLEGEDG